MTWLHLSVPALIVAALWAASRASDWFGAEGMELNAERERRRSGLAMVMFIRGWLWLGSTLFLAVCAGFVWGRIL